MNAPAGMCPHCHGNLAIRNPSGYCDHLQYPDSCEVCRQQTGHTRQTYVEGLRIAKEIAYHVLSTGTGVTFNDFVSDLCEKIDEEIKRHGGQV